ncbi:MAG: hypothetical protein P8P74_10955 [Crocinitomicaceae bacterium]|nr:hypothetical protein [Crocinitomicaceae bacterium]
MKLKTLLFSAFMLTTFFMLAQDWSTDVYKYGELYPGYIVDTDGNKTEGFIKYQNRYSLQNNILFYTDKNDKKTKTKYKSQDLAEYKVADKLYHCIHYSGGALKKPIRGNLVVNEDCITEYVWYDRDENYSTMRKQSGETQEEFLNRLYPPTTLFLKDGEEEVRTIASFALKFSKKMSEWIGDNLDLAGKVAAKEKGYKVLNLLQIIDEYNESCEK